MRSQSINRADAEIMWGVFHNVSGGVMSNGHAAQLTNLAASLDGNGIVNPITNQGALFVGVVAEDIADNGYGLVQTYGYKDSIHLFALGTAITVTANDIVGQGATASNGGFGSAARADKATVLGPVIALETSQVNTGAYIKGFIRAM